MVDVKKFKFYLKKDKYYDDIEDIKSSIEKNMDYQIKKYYDEHPNFHVIDIKTGWFDNEENYIFSALKFRSAKRPKNMTANLTLKNIFL